VSVILQKDIDKDPVDLALERFRAASRNFEQLQTIPEPEWLIDGVLPKQAFACLWGDSGIGKSFVSIDWSMSLACGVDWFGEYAKQTNVLYVYGEGASGMKRRANAWVHEHGVYPEDEMLWVGRMVNVFEEPQILAIKQLADEHSAGLVVIDTLARAMAGHSENDATEMGKLVQASEWMRDELGATVLFIHHANTSADKKMRGSSALKGALDVEIQLDVVDPDYPQSLRTLRCRKQKDGKPFNDINVHFAEVQNSLVPVQRHISPISNNDMLYA
jgi:RecA-family ATPase